MTNEEFIESIKLDGEEWRTTTVSDRYAVSNYGRVLSYAISYPSSKRVFSKGPNLVKPRINKLGYYRVSIYSGNHVSKSYLVHRLVAMAFIPNPNNLPYINHKDENPGNNRTDNLEWCTQKYNCNYGAHNCNLSNSKRNRPYQIKRVVKLSLSGEYIDQYSTIKDAANSVGVSPLFVGKCCHNQHKTCRGFKWMFLEDYEVATAAITSEHSIYQE